MEKNFNLSNGEYTVISIDCGRVAANKEVTDILGVIGNGPPGLGNWRRDASSWLLCIADEKSILLPRIYFRWANVSLTED